VRLPIPPHPQIYSLNLVEGEGFEPSKSLTTDLQSAPFGRSGTPPDIYGAGDGIRTRDLLITSQLLYQLSYTSIFIVFIFKLATWKGLEPSTSSVTGWHSNQLNYQAALFNNWWAQQGSNL
jgi:hypothetical protein